MAAFDELSPRSQQFVLQRLNQSDNAVLSDGDVALLNDFEGALAAQGAAQAEGARLGIDRDIGRFRTATSSFLRGVGSVAVAGGTLVDIAGELAGVDLDATQAVQGVVNRAAPINPEFLEGAVEGFVGGTFPQAIGSVVSFLGPGLAVKGVAIGRGVTKLAASRLGLGASAITAASLGASEAFARVEEADQEVAAMTKLLAAAGGGLIGLSEVAPLAKVFGPLNKLLGGAVAKTVAGSTRVARASGKAAARSFLITGFEEALQEGSSQLSQNQLFRVLIDAEASLTEGVIEGSLAGFLVGGAIGIVTGNLGDNIEQRGESAELAEFRLQIDQRQAEKDLDAQQAATQAPVPQQAPQAQPDAQESAATSTEAAQEAVPDTFEPLPGEDTGTDVLVEEALATPTQQEEVAQDVETQPSGRPGESQAAEGEADGSTIVPAEGQTAAQVAQAATEEVEPPISAPESAETSTLEGEGVDGILQRVGQPEVGPAEQAPAPARQRVLEQNETRQFTENELKGVEAAVKVLGGTGVKIEGNRVTFRGVAGRKIAFVAVEGAVESGKARGKTILGNNLVVEFEDGSVLTTDVLVAIGTNSIPTTIGHESFHVVRQLLSERENGRLDRIYEKRARRLYNRLKSKTNPLWANLTAQQRQDFREEAMAEDFGSREAALQAHPMLARLWDRVVALFDALFGTEAGQGRQIFRDIESGKVAKEALNVPLNISEALVSTKGSNAPITRLQSVALTPVSETKNFVQILAGHVAAGRDLIFSKSFLKRFTRTRKQLLEVKGDHSIPWLAQAVRQGPLGEVSVELLDNIMNRANLTEAQLITTIDKIEKRLESLTLLLTREGQAVRAELIDGNWKTLHEAGKPQKFAILNEYSTAIRALTDEIARMATDIGLMVNDKSVIKPAVRFANLAAILDTTVENITTVPRKTQDGDAPIGLDDAPQTGDGNLSVAAVEKILGRDPGSLSNADPTEQMKNIVSAINKEKPGGAPIEMSEVMIPAGMRLFEQRIDNFFPQYITQEVHDAIDFEQGPIWDAIENAVNLGKIDKVSFTFLKNDIIHDKHYGTIENTRSIKWPDTIVDADGNIIKLLETDPLKVYKVHVRKSAVRFANIEFLGQGDGDFQGKKLAQIEEAIKFSVDEGVTGPQKGFISELFHDAAEFAQGNINDPAFNEFRGPVNNAFTIVRGVQLSTASVSNVHGLVPIPVKLGVRVSANAFVGVMLANVNLASKQTVAQLELARSFNGWNINPLVGMTELENFSSGAKRFTQVLLKATGFEWINKVIDQTIALGTVQALDQSLIGLRNPKSGIIRKLWGLDEAGLRLMMKTEFNFSDADIERMKVSGPTNSDYAQAMTAERGKINVINESPLDKQKWFSNPYAAHIFAYTGYLRAQGNLISDAINTARDTGNIAPLTKAMMGPVAVALLTNAVFGKTMRDTLFNRDTDDDDFYDLLFQSYMEVGTFGLLGHLGENIYWSSKTGSVNIVSAPQVNMVAQVMIDVYTNLGLVFTDGVTEAAREEVKDIIRRIPALKAIDAHQEFPILEQ